jgi:diketogulonate reductase-like aldo/keto reductase
VRNRPFGAAAWPVAVVGQGTWQMERDDRRAAIDALRRGIDAGATHVDTAEMYGDGRVEELVGEAIAGLRDRVFLVSKVLPSNASFDGTIAACERSLRRLRTDRLDVYLLHWRGRRPLEETIAACARLIEQGKIRGFGVSNFAVEDLEEARAIAGAGRLACNQVLYHLGERAIEHEVIPWCERHRVAVVGYSPFGAGRFPPAPAGRRARGGWLRRGPGSGDVLQAIAREHDATPWQVALAFLARRRSLFLIPKASRADHVRENAAAADLGLRSDDVRRIEEAFPLGRRRSGVPML